MQNNRVVQGTPGTEHSSSAASGDFSTRLAIQAERIRQSGRLGRSDPLRRLLEYLVSRAGSTEAPKEIEIAEALGREYSYEGGQDASIRVLIHRLRKKLDEFYTSQPEGGDRLSIPLGSYRLALEMLGTLRQEETPPHNAAPPAMPEPAAPLVQSRRPAAQMFAAGALATLCLLAVVAGAMYLWTQRPRAPRSIATTQMWRPFIGSPFKNIYVVGDQALEGGHPHVLLMGSAKALVKMVPVLDPLLGPGARSTLNGTSFLAPSNVKEANIVFIGAFSQLGMLRSAVFSRSGFAEPDEAGTLTDKASGRRYASAPPPFVDHHELTSYGYLTCMMGPSGNRIVVISGATDGALVQMAEVALDAAQLDALAARGGSEFEALYAVSTLDGENVAHHLELVRPLAGSSPHA